MRRGRFKLPALKDERVEQCLRSCGSIFPPRLQWNGHLIYSFHRGYSETGHLIYSFHRGYSETGHLIYSPAPPVRTATYLSFLVLLLPLATACTVSTTAWGREREREGERGRERERERFVAQRPRRRVDLLGTGTSGKGGQKSETSRQAPTRKTEAAVDRRQKKQNVKAVSARHCAATTAPRNCSRTCYIEQSLKDNIRRSVVGKQLKKKKSNSQAQLHFPALDLFWANL